MAVGLVGERPTTFMPIAAAANELAEARLPLEVEQNRIRNLMLNPPEGVKIVDGSSDLIRFYIQLDGKLVAECERESPRDPYRLYLRFTESNSSEIAGLLALGGFQKPFVRAARDADLRVREAEIELADATAKQKLLLLVALARSNVPGQPDGGPVRPTRQ